MLKYFLKVLIITAFTIKLNIAQVTEEWVKRYNGSANQFDIVTKLLIDQTGNIYVYGTAFETNHQTDMIVLKYTPAGNLLWTYKYNGITNDQDWLNDAIIDLQENSYLAGRTTINDTQKIALVKITASGSFQWIQTINIQGAVNQQGNSVAIDPASNIYLLGAAQLSTNAAYLILAKYNSNGQSIRIQNFPGLENTGSAVKLKCDNLFNVFTGTNSFNDTTLNYDARLWKFDSTGAVQWVKFISGSANEPDAFIDMSPDAQNNICALAEIVNTGTLIDFRTVKFSQDGVLLWQKDFNGTANHYDYPFAITSDNQSNVYVTGYSRSGTTLGTEDAITIKYDAFGNIKWAKLYNGIGNGTDQGMAICADNDKNVYVGGATDTGNNKMAFMTIKYDSSGNRIWVKTYNYSTTTPEDFIYSIAVNTNRDVYVTGISFSNTSAYDFATIKYSQPIGVLPISNEIPKTFELFQNYPNPFNPFTTIRFEIPLLRGVDAEGRRGVLLVVYDILGREITTLVNEQLTPGTYEIGWPACRSCGAGRDASNYPSGMYYYQLTAGNFKETKKMVLIK